MIDTLVASVSWPLEDKLSPDWIRTVKQREIEVAWEDEPQAVTTTRSFVNKILGIRAYGSDRSISLVQFSAPRLIHGDNGELIHSQGELDDALDNLKAAISEIADPSPDIQEFRRVDLGLHFECDPKSVIAAHRNCKYPRTRKTGFRPINESSVSWDYIGRRFVFYDKGRERSEKFGGADHESEVLRVEIQLSKGPVKKLLGRDDGKKYPSELDFNHCYQVYRSELLKFAPPRQIAGTPGKEQALALLDKRNIRVAGLLPSELFTRHMTPSTRRRWLKKIREAHAELIDFDWSELLPEDSPPDFIDI